MNPVRLSRNTLMFSRIEYEPHHDLSLLLILPWALDFKLAPVIQREIFTV